MNILEEGNLPETSPDHWVNLTAKASSLELVRWPNALMINETEFVFGMFLHRADGSIEAALYYHTGETRTVAIINDLFFTEADYKAA